MTTGDPVRRGRAARQAARLSQAMEHLPYLTRELAPVEVISTEGLEQIEANADTLLEQVGIEIVNYPEATEIFRSAGADVVDQRVRFPRGLCRSLIQASAPRIFTQRARNPERSVVIGDPHVVLVPTYGSPFIHNLDDGRRYATIEDFRNFVKLTYASTVLHHSGGTLCEPVDLPVNKRHFEMVYSHIRYSDKAFMGSVTHPSRAQDSVEMARIVFGADTLEREHVIMGLANANSPMSWDFNMLGSAKAYAEANQIMLITPFILGGAMAPVTVAAQATQTLAEALAGMAFCQIVRPGAPVIFGSFASSMSMQTGAPTFGTPEPQLVLFVLAALARRLGVPFRSGGNFTASKLPDYQAAYESAISFMATMQAGVNFNLHTAGWLEGGLAIGYEKFMLDEDQASMAGAYLKGVDVTDNGYAMDAMLERRPRPALPGLAAHAGQLRDRVLALRALEQRQLRAVAARWRPRCRPAGQPALEGSAWPRTSRRPLDEGIHEELLAWMDAAPGELPRLRRLRRSRGHHPVARARVRDPAGPGGQAGPDQRAGGASCTCPRAPSRGCSPRWSSWARSCATTRPRPIGSARASPSWRAPMDFTTVAGRVHQAPPRPAVVGHRRGGRVLACPRATRCTTWSRSTVPGRSRSATTRGPRRRCTSRPPACAPWPNGRRPSSAATCHGRWSATPVQRHRPGGHPTTAGRDPRRRLRLDPRGVRRGPELGGRARPRREQRLVGAITVHGPTYRFPAAGRGRRIGVGGPPTAAGASRRRAWADVTDARRRHRGGGSGAVSRDRSSPSTDVRTGGSTRPPPPPRRPPRRGPAGGAARRPGCGNA